MGQFFIRHGETWKTGNLDPFSKSVNSSLSYPVPQIYQVFENLTYPEHINFEARKILSGKLILQQYAKCYGGWESSDSSIYVFQSIQIGLSATSSVSGIPQPGGLPPVRKYISLNASFKA